MHTIYAFAPFRRFSLGSHALLSGGTGARLGQSLISNLLKDIGIPSGIDQLIRDLPAEQQSFNQQRWNECKDMGLTTAKGAACALAVIEDIKAGKTTPPTVAPPSAASSFPVVPVLLGLAAAGGLVWFLSSRGK
jgi:hypothetical protein